MTTRPARRTDRRRRLTGPTAVSAAALLALSACSASSGTSGTDGAAAGSRSPSAPAGLSGTVTVFAAASLKESFTELGTRFEKAHPGTHVSLNFGGSDTLAAGITGGAPADVFAAASTRTMSVVTDQGDADGAPVTFARNQLEIATLPGNPDRITSLADLTRPGLKVVLCDASVPCGAAARKALDAGGVSLTPVSYEEDVKGALNKVVLKEADAALVYRTDVKAAGDKVAGVDFPEAARAVNDYPIVALKNGDNAAAARAFIDLVRSADGRKVLTDTGFRTP
ncbi:molybdate ABC transporter substrate-binding protein [Streptomyces actuosus]|uniref:molybdate ABC transporter substrate-binding protein n=1 Tax=Streptomyces actuosus TaxID=1885 RepID=UPI0027DAA803|nr:molybdate ABC transporter substrate-binding protein [Streptomyces actuosus]